MRREVKKVVLRMMAVAKRDMVEMMTELAKVKEVMAVTEDTASVVAAVLEVLEMR